MKTRIISIIIVLILIQLSSSSQKYRTAEQFQKYYLENINSINKIEGIWYCHTSATLNSAKSDHDPQVVAIIKEGQSFKQYTLKNGFYEPIPGIRGFENITSGYQYKRYYDDTGETLYGDPFYLYGNNKKFSFEMGFLEKARRDVRKRGLSSVRIYKAFYSYSYSKIFPLEGDIESAKKEIPKGKTGTGVAISSDGHIITNYHIIENASNIKIKGVKGSFYKTYSAKVVLSDRNNDLAILKINDYNFTSLGTIPYTIKAQSSNVGEDIFILGYPLTATMGEEIKLTNGIISSKSGFQGDITSYQMTAPIQPGNSGAPMFDQNGNIVGIINAKHFGAENAGYAIKVNYLLNLIDAAPSKITLPTINTLKGKPLPEQVNVIKKFVYIVEVD